ncbi:glycoside hydrolase family 5 protein [Moniliophthora roreri]|nr:glycoside hydrolase family 5 protein [Moniliophthora roreri]
MRFSVITALALTTLSSVLAFSPSFPYGKRKVRGVNLGGWLVLEPWISPSIFDNTGNPDIIDEWTFGLYQNPDVALATLQKHWDTFITEDDFAAISAAGLTHVRLPVGHWAFDVSDSEPYIQGQLPYVFKAIEWAKKYDLHVILDLHSAPGSQNGFDNSGQRLDTGPNWHRRKENIARTNKILKQIVATFQNETTVADTIAPLNEPAGFFGQLILNVTKQYWLDSYQSIRYPEGDSTKSDLLVLIHDTFQGISYWNGFMSAPQYEGVGIDTHVYQMFNDQTVRLNDTGHIQQACSSAKDIQSAVNMYVIVGEWTPSFHDCAKYLNGLGRGARYDGTLTTPKVGDCQNITGHAEYFSPEYKEFLRKMWEAQVISFESGAGWIQWTWKAEAADEWSYQAGLKHGWIPKDPTDLKYPDICSSLTAAKDTSKDVSKDVPKASTKNISKEATKETSEESTKEETEEAGAAPAKDGEVKGHRDRYKRRTLRR